MLQGRRLRTGGSLVGSTLQAVRRGHVQTVGHLGYAVARGHPPQVGHVGGLWGGLWAEGVVVVLGRRVVVGGVGRVLWAEAVRDGGHEVVLVQGELVVEDIGVLGRVVRRVGLFAVASVHRVVR